MEREDKTLVDVKINQQNAEIVPEEGSPLTEAATGVSCISSPTVVDGLQPSAMSSNEAAVSVDADHKRESNQQVSNNETLSEDPEVSETGATATGQEKCQETLPESSSKSCGNPKTDSGTDVALQIDQLSENEASDSVSNPDSAQRSSERSKTTPQFPTAQLLERSTKEDTQPNSSSNTLMSENQINSCPEEDNKETTHQKDEKGATYKEDNKEATCQEDDKEVTSQEDDKEVTNKEDDKEVTSQKDDKEVTSQKDDKEVTSQEDGKEGTSQEDGKEGTSQEDGKKVTSREDGKEVISQENGKELTNQEDSEGATSPSHERELLSPVHEVDDESQPILDTQISSCSMSLESNQSPKNSCIDKKSQENYEVASQEREAESHDKLERCVGNQASTAPTSSIQSASTDSCLIDKDSKSQSAFSESATVDESSNMSTETVPSMAHADLDQVNIEEPMDTISPCEDSDPFCLKDTEKYDNASKEADVGLNPVTVAKDSYVSDTANKSSNDETIHKGEGISSKTSEVDPLPKSVGEQGHSATLADDMMEVDTSPTGSEHTNPVQSNELDNDPSKDTASPEQVQTIIGDKMGEEAEIALSDTTNLGESENSKTSPDETSSVKVPSSLAGQQEITESQSAHKSSSESSSSCATEKGSTEQSSIDDPRSDVSANEELGAQKKNLDTNKHKVGIHLVSTSSLVSRQNTSDSETDTDVLESGKINDVNVQTEDSQDENCVECGKTVKCKYKIQKAMGCVYLCEDDCYSKYRKANDSPRSRAIRPRKMDQSYEHKCGLCSKHVDMKLEKTLTWETMDFCDAECLEKCQRTHGSNCANCKAYVQSASLGKYCVRFGYDMKQFCSAPCLEDFKKGLKVCSYCQKDISRGDGFLAPVGDKGAFKDFCAQECMEKYEQMSNNTVPPEVTQECAVCNEVKPVKVEIILDSKLQKLCSEPCFAAFKFVNNIVADKCDMCKKYYDHDRSENFTVFYDEAPHSFCCKTCMNVYILAKRKIVPCSWCKVKKYNFDMIKKISGGQNVMMCSLHCLELHQASPTVAAASKLGVPRKIAVKKGGLVAATNVEKEKSTNISRTMPVISSVTSLAPTTGQLPPVAPDPPATLAPVAPITSSATNKSAPSDTVKTVYKQQFILRPPPHPEMRNCAVQVKPRTMTKSVSCQPELCEVSTQTDDSMFQPVLIPIPVPIYIPMPMHMYTIPYPVPVPIALPIPVPFFIPTTKNSAKGILQEIKRIQENIPSDPFEAELLMMAEMVAGEKKGEHTETDSEDGGNDADDSHANDAENATEADFSPEHQDTIGDDVLQMALKMASDFGEPAADFGGTVAPTSVSKSRPSRAVEGKDESEEEDTEAVRSTRSGKKIIKRSSSRSSSVSSKRLRSSSASDSQSTQPVHDLKAFVQEHSVEKPDANMCLKFALGVNAWKNWVTQKNAELEKSPSNKMKPFKNELLQLTADELNYSLCLFVCEAQDPNSQPYSPDTLYYLCLGIQQYFMENGRVDNIFCDPYYEKFTDCLDDAVKRFTPLQNDSQHLVTRIQEEHLWESKQLGAYSPFVLLNTLMYFNTKHFNVMTVEEHMQLSFTHIMKHWKRNASSPNSKTLGGKSNSVLLRFYPPQSALAGNSKKKKVYEQQENETNPLRCPVKLYEFYLSKCPESVKTRNDVFYLLPERSCVPDSPVWYSTMSLDLPHLQKMLHRIKVVREIIDI